MLNISIVLYHPNWEQEVLPLVEELLRVKNLHKLYLLDNSEERELHPQKVIKHSKLRYMHMPSNLGYGKAHNVALRESAYEETDFHLVMNSDIRVKAEDIDAMHDFMQAHTEVGHLMPRVVGPDGQQQYLAKRLPTPLDVFGRRFLPARWMAKRNYKYELRDKDLERPVNAPYLSGCFMFLRTKSAVESGLFDERYFMYPEDIDLTRSIHRNCGRSFTRTHKPRIKTDICFGSISKTYVAISINTVGSSTPSVRHSTTCKSSTLHR